ncbi:MAG: glycine--tRNA ligase subunit beta, partial [Peptostreptococcaceae bacterium]|nr:glycine--tRNA ligase subunit beta [Peptostreptococcaceae bacterium]
TMFDQDEEKLLYNNYKAIKDDVDDLNRKYEYVSALIKISEIVPKIDNFFDNVMIMADDEKIKNNRLALVSKLKEMSLNIADFSKIVM